jgi:hypothetical protein
MRTKLSVQVAVKGWLNHESRHKDAWPGFYQSSLHSPVEQKNIAVHILLGISMFDVEIF